MRNTYPAKQQSPSMLDRRSLTRQWLCMWFDMNPAVGKKVLAAMFSAIGVTRAASVCRIPPRPAPAPWRALAAEGTDSSSRLR